MKILISALHLNVPKNRWPFFLGHWPSRLITDLHPKVDGYPLLPQHMLSCVTFILLLQRLFPLSWGSKTLSSWCVYYLLSLASCHLGQRRKIVEFSPQKGFLCFCKKFGSSEANDSHTSWQMAKVSWGTGKSCSDRNHLLFRSS